MSLLNTFLLRPLIALAAVLLLNACDELPAGSGSAAVDPNAPVAVALLVPLGAGDGVTEQLAMNMVNAAKMAVADVSNANIDLRVYETAGDAGAAGAAAARAIEEGAQIILGPLYSSTTTAVAGVAKAAGVNVISFSNNPAVAGGNVFVLGITFDNIADRLVANSIGAGFANFAIVHQEGIEGEAGRAAVAGAINRQGGTLTVTAHYPLQLQLMGEQASGIAEQLRGSGANAVFFTDSPLGGLGFITASLASNRFRTNRDAQFMGLTRWDSSDEVLVTPSLQGGWFAVPDPNPLLEFQTRYQLAYGTEAHSLSGLAYDGVAAVAAMIQAARAAGDSNAFSIQRLTDPAGFAGVTGIFRFRTDGTPEHGLAIMQVSNGVATVVSAAPRSFGAAGGL